MDTSGHTPAADMIKWVWLDVLYVIHVTIGVPPVTQSYYLQGRRHKILRGVS